MSSGVKKMTGGVKKRTGDVKMLERSGLPLFQNRCHVPAMQWSIVHTLDSKSEYNEKDSMLSTKQFSTITSNVSVITKHRNIIYQI